MEIAVLLPVMVSLPKSSGGNQTKQKEAEHHLTASNCPERLAVQCDNAKLDSSYC